MSTWPYHLADEVRTKLEGGGARLGPCDLRRHRHRIIRPLREGLRTALKGEKHQAALEGCLEVAATKLEGRLRRRRGWQAHSKLARGWQAHSRLTRGWRAHSGQKRRLSSLGGSGGRLSAVRILQNLHSAKLAWGGIVEKAICQVLSGKLGLEGMCEDEIEQVAREAEAHPCEDPADILADLDREAQEQEAKRPTGWIPVTSGATRDDLMMQARHTTKTNLYPGQRLAKGLWSFEPSRKMAPGLHIPNAVFYSDGTLNTPSVPVINVGHSTRWMDPAHSLGYVHPITRSDIMKELKDGQLMSAEEWKAILETMSEDERAHAEEMWGIISANITTDLTEKQLDVVRMLVFRFHSTWSDKSEKPKPSTKIPDYLHGSIPMENPKPSYIRRNPRGPAENEAIERFVRELYDRDMIRPSRSPWASPVLLVKKKGAGNDKTKWRVTLDLRAVNAQTIPD